MGCNAWNHAPDCDCGWGWGGTIHGHSAGFTVAMHHSTHQCRNQLRCHAVI